MGLQTLEKNQYKKLYIRFFFKFCNLDSEYNIWWKYPKTFTGKSLPIISSVGTCYFIETTCFSEASNYVFQIHYYFQVKFLFHKKM